MIVLDRPRNRCTRASAIRTSSEVTWEEGGKCSRVGLYPCWNMLLRRVGLSAGSVCAGSVRVRVRVCFAKGGGGGGTRPAMRAMKGCALRHLYITSLSCLMK